MDQFNLKVYAKEEALKAIFNSYFDANLDVLVTTVFEGCELGQYAKPQDSFKIAYVENGKLINVSIDCITLRYRMRYKNSPIFDKKGIRCLLSMSGTFTNTYVPYANIMSVTLDANPEFNISFPYTPIEAEVETISKPKQRAKLRIIK